VGDKKYFTLIAMTNDASRARRYRIPRGLMKIAMAAGVVVVLAMAFVVYDYARLKSNAYELYSLRKQTTRQRIELQNFSAKISDLESQLTKLRLFDKKLRIIANIKEPRDKRHPEQMRGIGGGLASGDNGPFGTPGEKVDELISRMRSDIRQLEYRTSTQERSFTELQERLIRKSSFLASTPSIWPARGWVTSVYGERISPFTGFKQMHKGLDIANRVGTPVVAPADGIVLRVGRVGSLGKMVSISHGYGMKTTYGHLSKIFVKRGQRVKRGQKIAAMGNTGHSTGPHLHYEVTVNGIRMNPYKYILN